MNAARDVPALFTSLKLVSSKIASAMIAPSGPVSSKLASARLAPVGRNFTASYELQDAAYPYRLDLKFKAEF